MTTTIGGSYPAVNSDSDATINGLTVGKGGGAVATNTAVGSGAMTSSNTGLSSVFGYQAGFGATGAALTAIGYQAGYSNTDGNGGVFVGYQSGKVNTTGEANVGVGANTLLANTTGSFNVSIGKEALRANTTASSNTAVGYQAGYAVTTGPNVVAVGYQASYALTTGGYSTAIGWGALSANTTSNGNVAVGYRAGQSATTGDGNTLIGSSAGYLITTGAKNTVLGQYTGNNGGLDIRTASNNIVLSDGDGNPRLYSDASGRIRIGGVSGGNDIFRALQSAAQSTATFENSNATPTGISIYFSGASPNNTTQDFFNCGDTTNAKLYVYSNGTVSNRTGTYNTISDVKIKQDIVDAGSQWNDIKAVRFRKYRLIDDVKANSDAPYLLGVVAQELEETSPNLIDECFDKYSGEMTKGVKTSVLLMKAAKALQEAMERIETLEAKVNTLENK